MREKDLLPRYGNKFLGVEMANRVSDFMARVGGGDKAILAEVPQDRMRFIQMAGVLFTTSGIAALSMMFALHNGVKAPLWAAVALGLIWGLIIFNIDRFLVLSMGDTRTRGWRLAGMMLPRIALAALLAAVVSTPLVLRIFERDINEQLFVIHQQQSRQIAMLVRNSADYQEASSLKAQINTDQGILNGKLPQTISDPQLQTDQAQVQKLQSETRHDFTVANHAYQRWQCELLGQTCLGGTGIPGNGAQARAKQRLYLSAHNTYETTRAALQAAQKAAGKEQGSFGQYQKGRLQKLQQEARGALPGLRNKYNALEKKVQAAIASGDNANEADTGILAQLHALSAASARNSSLEAARWTVLALFFVIEILPVTVKALLNLGAPSTYEKVLIEREGEIADREYVHRSEKRRIEEDESQARIKKVQDQIKIGELDSETRMKIEQGKSDARLKAAEDMRRREEGISEEANTYVAEEMTKLVDLALNEWGERIRSRLASDTGQSGNGDMPGSQAHATPGYGLPDEGTL
jgi:hypothetical protein